MNSLPSLSRCAASGKASEATTDKTCGCWVCLLIKHDQAIPIRKWKKIYLLEINSYEFMWIQYIVGFYSLYRCSEELQWLQSMVMQCHTHQAFPTFEMAWLPSALTALQESNAGKSYQKRTWRRRWRAPGLPQAQDFPNFSQTYSLISICFFFSGLCKKITVQNRFWIAWLFSTPPARDKGVFLRHRWSDLVRMPEAHLSQ